MTIRIMDAAMILEIDNCVATARFSEHAAADGSGAWIVSRVFVPAVCRVRSREILDRSLSGHSWHDHFVFAWCVSAVAADRSGARPGGGGG
jgi:hypothetical protein